MSYRIEITATARRDLLRSPAPVKRRLVTAIDALTDTPCPPGCIKLTGETAYRIRVGDYRIIYEVNDPDKTILIIRARHRRDVYR